MKYQEWLNGCGCCSEIRECIPSSGNPCDCDSILLELSKQHTDDLTLQDEIDNLDEKKLDISAYTPVDLTDYYTKEEVDELIPDVPSLSGYATEEWVNNQGFLKTVEPLKTINGETLIGEGNIVISGETIDAYTKQESDAKYQPKGNYATKDEIPVIPTNVSAFINDAGYVTNSELIQYITNLQEQINSLVSSISGCCGESGETQYRWITMTGENDYWCSGTTKMSKEKQQSSSDGINWTDTGTIRSGSTILEENCVACGYSGGSRIQITYSATTSPTKIANVCSQNVESVQINYSPNPVVFNNCVTTVNSAITSGHTVTTDKYTSTIENDEYSDTLMWKGSVSTEITSIGNGAFSGNTILSSFTIGNYSRLDPDNQDPDSQLTSIGDYAFKDCSNLTAFGISHCRNAVPTLGTGAFDGCSSLQRILVDNSMVNAFKTSPGWSTYESIIEGI